MRKKERGADDAVVLIHGTFASNAVWVSSDSQLGKGIAERLPAVRIEAFRWSGQNTHSARIGAGEALARRIDQLATELAPQAGIHLIGHSHGGNVALYARDRTKHADRIRSISFLGTPFLHIVPYDINSHVALWATIASVATVLMAVPILLFALLDWHVADPILDLFMSRTAGDYDFGRIFVGLMVWGWLWDRLFRDGGWHAKLRTWLTNIVQGESEAFAAWIGQQSPTVPTFIAFTRADEARMWLKGANRIGGMPATGFAILRAIIWPVVLTSILCYVALQFVQEYISLRVTDPDSLDAMRDPLGIFEMLFNASLIVLVLPIVMVLANMIFRSNPFFFGWEHPLSAIACGLRPTAVPDWATRAEVVLYRTEVDGNAGLRHSNFYEDPPTIHALSCWLSGDPIDSLVVQKREMSAHLPERLRKRLAWSAVAITAAYCSVNAVINLRLADAPGPSQEAKSAPPVMDPLEKVKIQDFSSASVRRKSEAPSAE